ncbi:hypothetical protein ABZW02_20200 [Streptomyces sp. NPDC005180]
MTTQPTEPKVHVWRCEDCGHTIRCAAPALLDKLARAHATRRHGGGQ